MFDTTPSITSSVMAMCGSLDGHEEKNAADAKPSPGLRSEEDQLPDAINLEQARQRLNDFLADSGPAHLRTHTAPYATQAVVIDVAKRRIAGKIAAFEESFTIAARNNEHT